MTVTATNLALNIDAGIVIDFLSDSYAVVLTEPEYVAPSGYPAWAKNKKRKWSTPALPEPVQAGEIIVDEAVLRQMEEERLAALVIQKKAEALQRVENLRDAAALRQGRLNYKYRFDVVETSPGVRRRVLTLLREQQPPPAKETVPNFTTLGALGPRNLPEPEIRKARTISLRRAPSRSMQTGLTPNG